MQGFRNNNIKDLIGNIVVAMSFLNFFSNFGSAIGGAFGGGILRNIGRFAGKILGNYLNDISSPQEEEYFHYKKQLELLHVHSDAAGKIIPLVFGRSKVSSQLIWSTPIQETERVTKVSKLFGGKKKVRNDVEYTYYCSFALAICKGEIDCIERIWVNDSLLDLSRYNYTLYKGSEDQEPDPIILLDKGSKTCAFRGLAYIVFKDMPLEEFSNKIPSISFEVVRNLQTTDTHLKEESINSIIVIPGSGEFVYDTILQYRTFVTNQGIELSTECINSHNYDNIPDSIYNLEQLLITCPNLESIGLVVCWFGNSLDIKECRIRPYVEHKSHGVRMSEQWKVKNFSRTTAKLMTKEGRHPRYGGSINDASLVRYITELKRKGIKITLYPMFFLDLPGKPWRGHVTGRPEDVEEFFNTQYGYNNFILHYAELTKDLVDSFVIGSELCNITSIQTSENHFPAVDSLISLAQKVRNEMGDKVKLTYAADWTEYHGTKEGWFHLDPLWSDPNIDFIGIDLYAPLTSNIESRNSPEDIKNGWRGGMGSDYLLDKRGNQIILDSVQAWKNIQYWWDNEHINPDGQKTLWKNRMKKICFTEFGYPSIDKATNQPNVFFDPKCIDSNIPKNSTGQTDFAIQKLAIIQALKTWKSNEMLEGMYLWAWDARPYPAWPHYHIWSDSYLWEKGHWINHKFAANSVANVINAICNEAGIGEEELEFIRLDIAISGVLFDKNISGLDAINLLRCGYFFDIYQREDRLVFQKRGSNVFYDLDKSSLVSKNEAHFFLDELTDEETLKEIQLSFINQKKRYDIDKVHTNCDIYSNHKVHFLYLPIILSEPEVSELSYTIINNARAENKTLTFYLPLTYLELNPCDILALDILSKKYFLRIVDIKWEKLLLKIVAIPEDVKVYDINYNQSLPNAEYSGTIIAPYIFLDLPYLIRKSKDNNYIDVAYREDKPIELYASLNGIEFEPIGNLSKPTTIGKVVSIDNYLQASDCYLDNTSRIVIYSKRKLNSVTHEDLLGGKNLALIGKEIIGFRDVTQIAPYHYELNFLVRGVMSTEEYINSHKEDEDFVFISGHISSIEVDDTLLKKKIFLKVGSQNPSIFEVPAKIPPTPSNLKCKELDYQFKFSWLGKHMYFDFWENIPNDKVSYEIAIFKEREVLFYETQINFLCVDKKEVWESEDMQIEIKTIVGDFKSMIYKRNICIENDTLIIREFEEQGQ